MDEKMSEALDKIQMASAKVTENGKKSVNVPNKVFESVVKESFVSKFSGGFCLDEVKKTHDENRNYKCSERYD